LVSFYFQPILLVQSLFSLFWQVFY